MKLHWGNGIAIFYSSFVVIMISMVIKASQTNVNMVQENYYDQDLNYEQFRKSRQNGLIPGLMTIQYIPDNGKVQIGFPSGDQNITGVVKLYRPSNNGWDQTMTIDLDDQNRMEVAVSQLARGYWKILVHWESDGKSYYREEPLIL